MKRLIVIIVFFFSIKGHSQRQVSDFKEMIDSAIYLKSFAFSKTAKSHTVRIAYNMDLYLIDEKNFEGVKKSSRFGGTVYIEISMKAGTILKVTHGK
ncbi:MAG TPA: hypothetical protein VGM30_12670 [Puia sp.]|jgi:hypothetical protein